MRDPDPDSAPVYTIQPGRTGNLIKASRKSTRDGVYNIVVAYGSDPAAPTSYQLAYNNDPTSPLRWTSQFAPAPRYYASPLLRTPDAARQAAATILSRYTGLPETLGLWTTPNPAIRPQDAIAARVRGLAETHIVDTVTIPLSIAGGGPVEVATKTTNQVVIPETDDSGSGIGTPTQAQIDQEKCFEITSTAENSTIAWWTEFGYLQDIGDGRGYTCGIAGFTSATGDLLKLVQNYTSTKPGNVLAQFVPGLQTCANVGMGGSASSTANAQLGTPFRNAWALAAQDKVFQDTQIAYRDQVYWVPAYNAAVADGLTGTSPAVQAAQAIHDRIQSAQGIFEDWTWAGAPAVVGAWNDELIAEYKAAHGGAYTFPADVDNGNVTNWLSSYVTGHAASHVLGLSIYFDTMLNHGPGVAGSGDGSFDDIRSRTTSSGGGTPHTVGQTANSGSSSTSSADKSVVSKFTAGFAGTLTGGHARLALSAGGSTTASLVVYADASGAPGTRLAQSDPKSISNTTEAQIDFTFTGTNQVAVANGTSYWIGPSWQDPGSINVVYSRDATTAQAQAVTAYAPTTFGTGTAQAGPVDAWIDIVTAGGGSGPPSQGGGETAWLTAFLSTRSAVLIAWGDNPPNGRISMFTGLLGTGNLTLTCPFTWSVYGDSYTMSTDPTPYGFTPHTGGGSTTYPNPGVAHNIGSQPGQNSFNLGVGFDGDATYGTTHHDFSRAEIEAGLVVPGYYELTPAGEVLMSSHPGGGTTSSNTQYPRVEYRELERDGTTKMAFDATSGRHYIKGRSAVDSLSAPKPEMVIAQVHDGNDDRAMIYRRNATTVQAKIGNTIVATLDSGDSLTHFDDWMIEIVDGVINFYWGDLTTPKYSQAAFTSNASGFYFKAGSYMQWNLSNGDATIGKVRLVNLEHWHSKTPKSSSPWPQPARPAGQSTGGSTGGGTGSAGFFAKYFVATTGSDSNSGLSKASPKQTIAAALSLAAPGDTISVAAGTYTGNITIGSGGSSGGGYVTIRSETPRTAIISGTGSGSQSAIRINAGYVRLQELSITGTLSSGVRYGVDIEASNVEVLNCHIYQICKFRTEGTSFQGGAGINFDQSSYTHILIDGNEINDIGPGVGVEQLVHGIYCGTNGTDFRITNNLIYACEDFGVHEYPTGNSSGIHVVNNTIAECGRGILQGSDGAVVNNIVYNCLAGPNYDIRESGNTISNNFSGGAHGNVTGISGIASGVDVKFNRLASDGTGDFRLQPTSPALNAGTQNDAPPRDFAGTVRPQGVAVDAGCFETPVGATTGGGSTGGTGGSPGTGSTGGATNSDDGVEAAKLLGWGPVVDGDEFAYVGAPNSRWGVYDGPGNGGNGTRTPAAFNVANGILTCTGDANGNTGGMAFDRDQKYYRIEWRIRAYSINPKGSGRRYHPVLILWPTSDEWPQGGEYDFAEYDCDSGLYEAFLHIPGNDGSAQEYVKRQFDISQWHNVAFEWRSNGITGWLNGQQVFDFPGFKQPPGPMHPTIQLDANYDSGLEPARFEAMFCRIYAPPS